MRPYDVPADEIVLPTGEEESVGQDPVLPSDDQDDFDASMRAGLQSVANILRRRRRHP